jgi:molybdate transport system substrate-binding protein
MMRTKSWQFGLFIVGVTLASIVATQCASIARQSDQIALQPPAPASTILVAAAASLQKSLQEITPIYTKTNPSQTVNYTFAASGVLQQQIQQGAPVDVFIAAANKQMDDLQSQGLLVPKTKKNLLTNQLVLITPKQSTLSLESFQKLINPSIKRISIGEARSVPVGQYATEVFKSLGILDRIKSKFVLGNNVKAVLTTVETGDVDAGIVYITDAQGSDSVKIAAIADEKLHSPIRYPIAVLKSSKSIEASKRYVEFLRSDIAKAVFRKYGFGIAQP